MKTIDWDAFKVYKRMRENPQKLDNFHLLMAFVRSYYNMRNAYEVFRLLERDELGIMMLQKRDIRAPDELEKYL